MAKKAKMAVEIINVGEPVVEEKCRYCDSCEGVVQTPAKLPYYGRVVTVCGEGYNTLDRCHKFELLCMEAQRKFIVAKQEAKA